MKDMPKSAVKHYKIWISNYPESFHPADLNRFYLFVKDIMRNSKKIRSRYWLEDNIKEDCPKLSNEDIESYCDRYQHVLEYLKRNEGLYGMSLAYDPTEIRK